MPHVYTAEESFLAGIFQFGTRDDFRFFGHNEAVRILDEEFVDQFFWGLEGETLDEIPLTHSAYSSANSLFFGLITGNHRYHIFEPGSLAPDTYKWRWETSNPFQGAFVAHGTVIIVDA